MILSFRTEPCSHGCQSIKNGGETMPLYHIIQSVITSINSVPQFLGDFRNVTYIYRKIFSPPKLKSRHRAEMRTMREKRRSTYRRVTVSRKVIDVKHDIVDAFAQIATRPHCVYYFLNVFHRDKRENLSIKLNNKINNNLSFLSLGWLMINWVICKMRCHLNILFLSHEIWNT